MIDCKVLKRVVPMPMSSFPMSCYFSNRKEVYKSIWHCLQTKRQSDVNPNVLQPVHVWRSLGIVNKINTMSSAPFPNVER